MPLTGLTASSPRAARLLTQLLLYSKPMYGRLACRMASQIRHSCGSGSTRSGKTDWRTRRCELLNPPSFRLL